jgi:hypothetical protein
MFIKERGKRVIKLSFVSFFYVFKFNMNEDLFEKEKLPLQKCIFMVKTVEIERNLMKSEV